MLLHYKLQPANTQESYKVQNHLTTGRQNFQLMQGNILQGNILLCSSQVPQNMLQRAQGSKTFKKELYHPLQNTPRAPLLVQGMMNTGNNICSSISLRQGRDLHTPTKDIPCKPTLLHTERKKSKPHKRQTWYTILYIDFNTTIQE